MTDNALNGRLLALEILLSKCVAKHLHNYPQEEEKDLAMRRLLEVVLSASGDRPQETQSAAAEAAQRVLERGRRDASTESSL